MTRTGGWVVQAGELLLGEGIRGPGYAVIDGDRIAEVAEGRYPRPDLDCAHDTLVPGFIDLQVNGAAGCDFLSPTESGLAAAHAYLLSTGTVAYLPTLISGPEDRLRAALSIFAKRARQPGAPRILGVHLEGPFLSPARAGAHRPEHLRTPSVEWIGRLIDDFQGVIRVVTLAPELDGALDVIAMLVSKGITVAVGHSDATYVQAMAAFDRGARLATHLFNAMRPYHHREPGVVGAALLHPAVTCSIIADMVHLHPAVVEQVVALKRSDRTMLVTDAVAAAGARDLSPTLGDQAVAVRDGAPRLPDGTLAGSVLAIDQAVRNLISRGIVPADAMRMASSTPARVLGLDRWGLVPGGQADLIVLDPDRRVKATIVAGEVVYRR